MTPLIKWTGCTIGQVIPDTTFVGSVVEEANGELSRFLYDSYLAFAWLIMIPFQDMIEKALVYSKQRKAFGVVIYRHQLVSDAFVQGVTEYELNRLYLQHLAESNQHLLPQLIRNIKFLAAAVAESADLITPVMGAYGMTDEAAIHEAIVRIYHLSCICQSLSETGCRV